MKKLLTALISGLALVSAAAWAAGADHPMVPRYPGSALITDDARTVSHQLLVRPLDDPSSGSGEKEESFTSVDGNLTRRAYRSPEGKAMSEVFRHYDDAVRAAGFEVLYNCRGESCSPRSAGMDFNARMAPKDLPKMKGKAKGQRYLAAKLRRNEGDVYASLYCTREEPLSQNDERNVFCNLIVVETATSKRD